jgi:hypothetical protein
MKRELSEEEVRVMTAQHWASVDAELDEFMDGVSVEFMRLYLQGLDRAIFDPEAEVTEEEAKEALQRLKDSVAFDRMMITFIQEVVGWPPADCVQLVMNSKHREWIRSTHQRYQGLKMYTGARKLPSGDRATPKLYGVPIVIDETATEPRLE